MQPHSARTDCATAGVTAAGGLSTQPAACVRTYARWRV